MYHVPYNVVENNCLKLSNDHGPLKFNVNACKLAFLNAEMNVIANGYKIIIDKIIIYRYVKKCWKNLLRLIELVVVFFIFSAICLIPLNPY